MFSNMAPKMERKSAFSVSIEDENSYQFESSPDEQDNYNFNETEDLDDKNAIKFIIKVTTSAFYRSSCMMRMVSAL
jgi:hypothetical protein